jgi:hypothetical protein
MNIRQLSLLAVATSLAMTWEAPTEAASYGIGKSAFFTQSSALPPSPSSSWMFGAHLSADTQGQVTEIWIHTPAGQQLMDTGDQFLFLSSPTYPSLAALNAAFPNGSYTFGISNGTLAPASAFVSFPAQDMFPSAVPSLNGDTFDRMASYNACQSFSFTWNGFVPHTNSNSSGYRGSFIIYPQSIGPQSFSSSVSSTNSVTVPGGTLQPNTAYRATLSFGNELRTANGGFGNFDSSVTFTYFTTFNFRTLPEAPREGLEIRTSQVELRWSTTNNALYQVQYRTSLASTQWINLGAPFQGDGTCKTMTDDLPQGRPQRYYRFVTLP